MFYFEKLSTTLAKLSFFEWTDSALPLRFMGKKRMQSSNRFAQSTESQSCWGVSSADHADHHQFTNLHQILSCVNFKDRRNICSRNSIDDAIRLSNCRHCFCRPIVRIVTFLTNGKTTSIVGNTSNIPRLLFIEESFGIDAQLKVCSHPLLLFFRRRLRRKTSGISTY